MSEPDPPTSDQLCPEFSPTFICSLPQGHDGYHSDSTWGIWKDTTDE